MKKGVSDLIAWVLLVGFSVSLAIIITIWTKEQISESTTQVSEMVEQDIRCGEVAINAKCAKCNGDVSSDTICVSNRGRIKIEEIILRSGANQKREIVNLAPSSAKDLSRSGLSNKLVVIPLIKVNAKTVSCSEKQLNVEC